MHDHFFKRFTFLSVIFLLIGQHVFAMGSSSTNTTEAPIKAAAAPKPKIKKVFIYIKSPEFKGRDTPLRADILKIAIDEVMKSEKYELIFTRNETWRDAKIDFVELIMEGQGQVWGKKLQGFNLQFYLVNGKSGKIMVTAKQDRIEDRRLIFTARSMIYQLFYGKELKDPKESSEPQPATAPEEVIKDEAVKPEKKQNKEINPKETTPKEAAPLEEEGKKNRPQKAPVTPATSKVDYNFRPPQPPKKKPNEADDDESNKEKSSKENEDVSGNKGADAAPIATAGKNSEELKPEPVPPKENDNKTPEELSQEINEEIEKIVKQAKKAQAAKEAEQAEDDKKDDQKKDTPAGIAEAEGLTPQAEKQYKTGGGESEKAKKVYLMRMLGLVQTTESTDLVETTNNIKHVGFGVLARLGMHPKSNDSLNLEFSMTVVVDSSKEFDIPGIKKLSIIYEKTFGDFFFHPHFGLEYETQSFINLAEAGGGLKVWENKLLWYKFGGGFYFKPKSYPLYMVGELGKTFVGTTNYGTDNKARTLDGTKKHFYLGMGTPWGFSLEFHMQVAEMTSQGFTNLSNTETTGYASMLYQF